MPPNWLWMGCVVGHYYHSPRCLLLAHCRPGRGRAQCPLMRAKRTLPARFSGPIVYRKRLPGPTVILPDDHKQRLCTASNARPLSLVITGKYELDQVDSSAGRLMHKIPTRNPTRPSWCPLLSASRTRYNQVEFLQAAQKQAGPKQPPNPQSGGGSPPHRRCDAAMLQSDRFYTAKTQSSHQCLPRHAPSLRNTLVSRGYWAHGPAPDGGTAGFEPQ
jgi:hypothetical protein